MNYTVNILILIILIGLYNLKTEHITNNLVMVSSIFFTLLTILSFIIKNKNKIKENYEKKIDDRSADVAAGRWHDRVRRRICA